MGTIAASDTVARRSAARLHLWLGIALVVLGPALYFLQFQARIFRVPYYLPILGWVGVALLVWAMLRRFNVWRLAALALCALFVSMESFLFVLLSSVPAYAGPAKTGMPFPEFHAQRGDGSSFSQDDLRGSQNTALIFFRGRW